MSHSLSNLSFRARFRFFTSLNLVSSQKKEKKEALLHFCLQITSLISCMTGWNAQHDTHLTEELHCALACTFYLSSFLFLLLPKMQSKSSLYGKRVVSLFVGQRTVITPTSYASTSPAFENFKLFSIYSSQHGLQTFASENLIVI